MSEEVKTLILEDWANQLENWSMDRIWAALTNWRDANPRRRPNPSDIKLMLSAEWGREKAAEARAARAAEAEAEAQAHEPISAERANSILAELGFAVKRIEPPKNEASSAERQAMIDNLQDTNDR